MKRLLLSVFSVTLAASVSAAGRQYAAYRSFLPSVPMTARFAAEGVTVRGFGVCNTVCGDGSRLYSDPITWKGIGEYDWKGVDTMVAELLPVAVNERLLAVHSATAGEKTIRFKAPVAEVADALTGQILARDVKTFGLPFDGPDTRILELRP